MKDEPAAASGNGLLMGEHARRIHMPGWLLAACISVAACAPPPGKQTSIISGSDSALFVADFDSLWGLIRDNYAYLDTRHIDWKRVPTVYRPVVAGVSTKRQLVGVLEDVLEELYDPHAHLGVNTADSPRLIPSGTDLWAEWQDDRAMITDVRMHSAAERAGLHAGMEIVTVDGRPVGEVVERRLPASLIERDTAALVWALRAAIAGRRGAPVRMETRSGDTLRAFEFVPQTFDRPERLLSAKPLEGNYGYVRLHNSLGDIGLIAAFDSALSALRSSRGLIIDLRDTPGGGNTTVARAIIGRFIAREGPYQRHELVSEARRYRARRIWVEYAAPRGEIYDGPVVVLVGRWTGSMGEGIAVGFHALKRATIAGTRMAGLRGAVYEYALPNSGFVLKVPAERLYHVDGLPRELFVPDVLIPAVARGEGDPALEWALHFLRTRTSPAGVTPR